MKFSQVKLPNRVDPATVEELMVGRRTYLTAYKREENLRTRAESSMCIETLISLQEEMLDQTELTRLVYIEEKVNRIRLSVDGIELESRLYERKLDQIIDNPNNVLSHAEAFTVV
jgi:hypothetical protein